MHSGRKFKRCRAKILVYSIRIHWNSITRAILFPRYQTKLTIAYDVFCHRFIRFTILSTVPSMHVHLGPSSLIGPPATTGLMSFRPRSTRDFTSLGSVLGSSVAREASTQKTRLATGDWFRKGAAAPYRVLWSISVFEVQVCLQKPP